MKNFFSISFVFIILIAGLIGVFTLLFANDRQFVPNILLSTAAAAFYSLVALSCIFHFGGSIHNLAIGGLALCCLALAHALYTSWFGDAGNNVIQNRIALGVACLALLYVNLVLLIKPRSVRVRVLIAIAVGSVALDIFIAIPSIYSPLSSGFVVIGILTIIATCSTIAAVALNLSIHD
ncbi:hypothetical protein [Polycladidibacter hongkongensis]|uniref:hypothetical protein n=1 Tax=Polycladidibacter hongkongensis TaxID=1647556 RepID=UPI00082ABD76|nr:hypothetical protein [Pseudovibrio hongkongensis]